MFAKNLIVVWHNAAWPWANAAYETETGGRVNDIELRNNEKISVDIYGDQFVNVYILSNCIYGLDPDADCDVGQVTNLPIAEHQTLRGDDAIAFLQECGLC